MREIIVDGEGRGWTMGDGMPRYAAGCAAGAAVNFTASYLRQLHHNNVGVLVRVSCCVERAPRDCVCTRCSGGFSEFGFEVERGVTHTHIKNERTSSTNLNYNPEYRCGDGKLMPVLIRCSCVA